MVWLAIGDRNDDAEPSPSISSATLSGASVPVNALASHESKLPSSFLEDVHICLDALATCETCRRDPALVFLTFELVQLRPVGSEIR